MAVTEAERHRLYESLKVSLGASQADTFMNLMPPSDWNQFAMRSDIVELRAATESDIAELRAELKADIAELRSDIAELRGDLQKTFGTWLFASQAGVIMAVGVLLTILR